MVLRPFLTCMFLAWFDWSGLIQTGIFGKVRKCTGISKISEKSEIFEIPVHFRQFRYQFRTNFPKPKVRFWFRKIPEIPVSKISCFGKSESPKLIQFRIALFESCTTHSTRSLCECGGDRRTKVWSFIKKADVRKSFSFITRCQLSKLFYLL